MSCPICDLAACAARVASLEASCVEPQQAVVAGYGLYRDVVAQVLRHHGYASELCAVHARKPLRDVEPTLSDLDKKRAADRQVSLFAAELRARR